MKKLFYSKNIAVSAITLLIVSMFTNCGSRDDKAGISTPSNLSTFASFQTIGSPTTFVNITGSTTGPMSKQPFTSSVSGAAVEVTVSGTFTYSPQSAGGAELTFISQIVSFGGLNNSVIESVVTLKEACRLLSITLPEQEAYELEFSESPFPNSTLGTYELLTTNEDDSQFASRGTFQFNTSSQFNENDINTDQ